MGNMMMMMITRQLSPPVFQQVAQHEHKSIMQCANYVKEAAAVNFGLQA
jgi:hypothetical protein